MECKCRKVYVSVNVDVDEAGTVHPCFIRWKNGLRFVPLEELIKWETA